MSLQQKMQLAALVAMTWTATGNLHAAENEYQVSLSPPLTACGQCVSKIKPCRQPSVQDRYSFGNIYGDYPSVSYADYSDCFQGGCDACCEPKTCTLIAYVTVSNACKCGSCVRELPLQIPADCACCEPTKSERCIVAGHHVVKYTWPSGFQVKIRLKKNGDARVIYRS